MAGRSERDEKTWDIPLDRIPDYTTFCRGTDLSDVTIGLPRNSFDPDKSPSTLPLKRLWRHQALLEQRWLTTQIFRRLTTLRSWISKLKVPLDHQSLKQTLPDIFRHLKRIPTIFAPQKISSNSPSNSQQKSILKRILGSFCGPMQRVLKWTARNTRKWSSRSAFWWRAGHFGRDTELQCRSVCRFIWLGNCKWPRCKDGLPCNICATWLLSSGHPIEHGKWVGCSSTGKASSISSILIVFSRDYLILTLVVTVCHSSRMHSRIEFCSEWLMHLSD